MRDYWAGPEAEAVRQRRRALRAGRPSDPLAERARKIAFWKECAKTNPHYAPHNGAWWWTMTWHRWARPLLMPRLRAMLDERDRVRKERYRAELREQARVWELVKAERAAQRKAARTGQAQLFKADAAC